MRLLLALALLVAGPAAARTQPTPSGEDAGQPTVEESALPPSTAGPVAFPPAVEAPLPPIPPPVYRDPRLREVVYDPNGVVTLSVAPGRQMTVLFGAGERIASVAVGDSGSWQVTAGRSGDSLFVKPLNASETNMTVITDAGVYLFDLVPGGAMDSVYLMRFVYPDAAAAEQVAPARMSRPYKVRGAKILRPDIISDDGFRTYIAWSAGKAMPAVFAIAPSGEEMLVDGYVRHGLYTIDRVYNRLIFRFDQKMATATRR